MYVLNSKCEAIKQPKKNKIKCAFVLSMVYFSCFFVHVHSLSPSFSFSLSFVFIKILLFLSFQRCKSSTILFGTHFSLTLIHSQYITFFSLLISLWRQQSQQLVGCTLLFILLFVVVVAVVFSFLPFYCGKNNQFSLNTVHRRMSIDSEVKGVATIFTEN